MAGKLEVLSELVDPIVKSLGCELWGIEFVSQGRQTLLRVFIDREEGGVGLSDCEAVSRQLSAVLDVEDPIPGEYTLEVSSPGMDRPIFTLEQYVRLAGSRVEMRLRVPFEGRRKYRGVITGVENDEVVVVCDDHEFLFPFDTIEKANVIPQF
ncbi:ribosome maturation factor RimP [Parendozoicomonas haliclonae]|uniref:Ribosome maturation factor RimP n=1 Tax=Parendozoicomonas haliclonae TaxID=1960125 RepID=A0A1X7ADM9_9GAMM|nr:ribosome maturation factor RimP [Parendozoicomonas haliclonae]SMA31670.1 Ribosome maturation factor RimP [Parendozoicomonas haliclonae]